MHLPNTTFSRAKDRVEMCPIDQLNQRCLSFCEQQLNSSDATKGYAKNKLSKE